MVQGKGDLQMNSPRNICPLPLQPLPPGKGREETKERTTAGLHSLFARRIPQSYILKLLDRLPRHGTLCLFGWGIRVSVVNGNLSCHDGIGTERRSFLLSKVNSNLKRLVLVGSNGLISLEALRWIADRDACLYMLDRRGKVLVACGPSAPSDARLHRAQSLALENGVALRISKELIRQKLAGQTTLLSDMLDN